MVSKSSPVEEVALVALQLAVSKYFPFYCYFFAVYYSDSSDHQLELSRFHHYNTWVEPEASTERPQLPNSSSGPGPLCLVVKLSCFLLISENGFLLKKCMAAWITTKSFADTSAYHNKLNTQSHTSVNKWRKMIHLLMVKWNSWYKLNRSLMFTPTLNTYLLPV